MISLYVNEVELEFEHSLVSLSDWESEFEKAFYPPEGKQEPKTEAEMLRYFELMLVGDSRKHRHLVSLLSGEQRLILANYIGKPRTATVVRQIQKSSGPKENVTSELIYYWMISFKIPFKPSDEWHLNRLLMLIKVCGAKQAPPPKNKQNRAQRAAEMRAENERRRAAMGTKG